MKKNRGLVSIFLLFVMACLSCAHSFDKDDRLSSAVEPELRWKYETGG
jgi:hypothetical protein